LGKAQFFGTSVVIIAQVRETERVTKAEQDKLDKEKRKEDAKIAKAIDLQVRAEKRKRERLEKVTAKKAIAEAKKATAEAKKVAKNAKPSRIVILKVGSSILLNIDVLEKAVIEELVTEAAGMVLTSRSGRPIILPQHLKK
jgi:hypothetical protein